MIPSDLDPLITGEVMVHAGRFHGVFRVRLLPERRAHLSVDGAQYCGVEHAGSITLAQSGAKTEHDYLRLKRPRPGPGYNDRPTEAGHKALLDGAREALRQWVAAHPLGWEAADCHAALAAADTANAAVSKARRDLADAEEAAQRATAHAAAHVLALAAKGVEP